MTEDLAGTAWTSHARSSRPSHQVSMLYFSLLWFLEVTWYFCNLHFSVSHLIQFYTRPLLWKCLFTSRWKKESASQDVSIWVPKTNGHSWKFWLWKLHRSRERGAMKALRSSCKYLFQQETNRVPFGAGFSIRAGDFLSIPGIFC